MATGVDGKKVCNGNTDNSVSADIRHG